jgi:signal peptide peptidase SppA
MLQDLTNLLSYRAWAFEKSFAERVIPFLLTQLKSGAISFENEKENTAKKVAGKYLGMDSQQIGYYASVRRVKAKSGQYVAIMPVVGSLTKRGEMCSAGMRDYSNEIARLNENEEIAAIVLDIESPGGTVDGTNEFGLSVKQSRKPVVVFGDGMVASAAYWVASQARHIMGNKNNPTEFGSIGTLYIHENWAKYIEENIGSVEILRAKQSVDKARVNVIEPLEENQRTEILTDLTDLTKDFISTVKKGRGNRLKSDADVFSGKMFKLDEAMKLGLIDSTGTIWDAVNKAAELATTTTKSSPNQKSNMSLKSAVGKLLGKKATTKAAEAEPAAAEPQGVAWAPELVFNTDGSGDGSICNHPDSDGNIRNFETKADNNTGNEPPTDPAVTEDDNWLLIAESTEAEEPADDAEAKASAQLAKANTRIAEFERNAKKDAAVISSLKRQLGEAKAKLEKTPAAATTTVVAKSDKGPEYGKKQAVNSWEKKAAQKVGAKLED